MVSPRDRQAFGCGRWTQQQGIASIHGIFQAGTIEIHTPSDAIFQGPATRLTRHYNALAD
jgi:hypothetical protein